jgi:diguanylate cyclase (GGDEF)-like protein
VSEASHNHTPNALRLLRRQVLAIVAGSFLLEVLAQTVVFSSGHLSWLPAFVSLVALSGLCGISIFLIYRLTDSKALRLSILIATVCLVGSQALRLTETMPWLEAAAVGRRLVLGRDLLQVMMTPTGIVLLLTTLYLALLHAVGIKWRLEASEEKFRELSTQDALTGLSNRRWLDSVLESEWLRSRRVRQPLAYLFIDVDEFKRYNDSQGHPAGDACLRRVAGAIRECVRRPGDLPCRYGGEEFAIILPNTHLEGAAHIAETIREAVEGLRIAHPASSVGRWITVSLGACATEEFDGPDAGLLVKAADMALYQAKAGGRNRVVAVQEAVTGAGEEVDQSRRARGTRRKPEGERGGRE